MIALIVLVWWPDENTKIFWPVSLTALAVYSIWNEIAELKMLNSKIEH